MSLSVNEFWNRLTASGLANADRCRQMAVAYAKDHQGRPPADVASLSTHLIEQRSLTPYQVQCVVEDRAQTLQIGPYMVQQPAAAPWQDWYWAANEGHPAAALVRTLDDDLSDLHRRTLAAQLNVDAPTLQPIRLERDGGKQYVVSDLPPGQSLSEQLRAGACDSEQTLRIGVAVANALSALHAASLPHGCIHPDRIWMGDDQSTWLLRDAVSGPEHPLSHHSRWFEPPAMPTLYAAPEFTIPGQASDALTDQYALGCLLLHARTGKPPFVAKTADDLLLAHAQSIPSALQRSLGGEGPGHPLLRVVGHAMAKNADARFADIRKLLDALTAVQRHAAQASGTRRRSATTPTPSPAPTTPVPATPETPKPVAPKPVAPAPVAPAPAAAVSGNGSPASQPVADVAPSAAAPAPASSAAPPTPETPAPEMPAPEMPAPAVATKPTPEPAKVARSAAAKAPAVAAPAASSPAPAAPPLADPEPAAQPVASAAASPEPGQAATAGKAATSGKAGQAAKSGQAGGKRRPPTGRRKKKKNMRGPLVIGGLGFAAMMLMVLVLGQMGKKKRDPADREPLVQRPYEPIDRPPPTTRPADQPTADPSGFEVVDNDRALWVPPSPADPPPLDMIPGGPQMIIVVRPRKLQQSAAGQHMLAAFDQELGDAWRQLEPRLGVPPEAIERLTIAFDSRGGGIPRMALGVHLAEPLPLATLQQRWDVEPQRTPEGATVLAGEGDDAFYVTDTSADAMIDRFAVGSVEQIKSVAELEGTVIPLPRQLENLWKAADGDAELNVLLLPNYLFADGRTMLQQYAPEYIEPLRTFLQPDAAGVLISSTLEPQWYLEARMMPGPRTTDAALAKKMEQSMAGLPAWAENFLLQSSPDPSWRALALRYPQMMQALRKYTRYGVSENMATANVYLPAQAAPNIALATLLAANTPRGNLASTAAMNPAAAAKPLTLEQMLELPLSVSFDQESLEFAGQAVMDELNANIPPGSATPKYVLLGSDLEKAGITQNQQIRDFKATDQPLRAILTQLVMKANIDKSVTKASQPEQLLVWVLGPDPSNAEQQAFLITTRAGAEGEYELPKEFVE